MPEASNEVALRRECVSLGVAVVFERDAEHITVWVRGEVEAVGLRHLRGLELPPAGVGASGSGAAFQRPGTVFSSLPLRLRNTKVTRQPVASFLSSQRARQSARGSLMTLT